jgi:hypothetical protein
MILALYARWLAIPAPIREPIRSFAVSAAFGLGTAISTAFTAYFFNSELHGQTWGGFFHLLTSPAFVGAAFLAIAAAYRARQGHQAATQTVETSAAVSVPKPPPPAKIVAVESVTDAGAASPP